MEEIVLQYTGKFENRFLEWTLRDAKHLRVIWCDGNGQRKTVFTGKEFSDEKFQKKITGSSSD